MKLLKRVSLIIFALTTIASVVVFCGCDKSNNKTGGTEPPKTEFTVTFVDADGEKIYDDKTYRIGEKIVEPAEPLKTGYSFRCWTYDGRRYNFDALPDADVELVADFEQTFVSRVVTLEINGNYEYISCLDGANFVLPQTAFRKADKQYIYDFEKWVIVDDGSEKDASGEYKVTKDLHFVAKFTQTLQSYTVTFIDNNYNEFASFKLNYGEEITLPDATPKGSMDKAYEYTFAGWNGYVPEMTVAGNVCFVANYKASPRVYEITYKAFDDVVKTETCAYDGALNFPTDFSYKGYDFSAWQWDGKLIDETAKVVGDMEIVATFTPIKYDIIFNTLSLYSKEPLQFTIEDEFVIPNDENMAMDGYEFLGWYVGDKKVEKIVKGTCGNVTLTARWSDKNFVLVTELTGVDKVYDKLPERLVYEVEYHDESLTVSYDWYFKATGEKEYTLLEEKGSTITVVNVLDSGEYYAKAVVNTGTKVKTSESAKVTVSIQKAEQRIHVQDVQTYVYDGELHGIKGIALSDASAEPIIGYGDSEYDGLIDSGEITVTITVPETDNYKEAMTTVKLVVEPRKVRIFAEELEYTGNDLWKDVSLYYTDVAGERQPAGAIEPYSIIDAGVYDVKAQPDSKNYVLDEQYTTIVKVLPAEYTGLVPEIAEQTGYINKTVSSIVLPDSSFVWKDVEEVMTKEGEYDAYYNAGANYKPRPVKISVKLIAKITFKTGNGDTGYDDTTTDVALGKTLVFPTVTNGDGEELIWFANDLGVGKFYRGDAKTPVVDDNKTYYGLWYYQSKASEYTTKGSVLHIYKGKVHARMILPTDSQYDSVYASDTTWNVSEALGIFNSGNLKSLIIPSNITKINHRKYISSATEVDAFGYCSNLSDVIIEGNCQISKLSFTSKGQGAHAITNLTLLGNGASRAANDNKLECNVWVSLLNASVYGSDVWGDKIKNYETL